MKECGHVFCSSCVRTCINQAGGKGNECPTCRTKAFDSHLQPHTALEAAAESWKAAR
jgi:E3 ubiquitin-protein ligase RAD18